MGSCVPQKDGRGTAFEVLSAELARRDKAAAIRDGESADLEYEGMAFVSDEPVSHYK